MQRKRTARTWLGSTPAAAVYRVILPSLMPMPLRPRSPAQPHQRNRSSGQMAVTIPNQPQERTREEAAAV
jgi:hypothetical protein